MSGVRANQKLDGERLRSLVGRPLVPFYEGDGVVNESLRPDERDGGDMAVPVRSFNPDGYFEDPAVVSSGTPTRGVSIDPAVLFATPVAASSGRSSPQTTGAMKRDRREKRREAHQHMAAGPPMSPDGNFATRGRSRRGGGGGGSRGRGGRGRDGSDGGGGRRSDSKDRRGGGRGGRGGGNFAHSKFQAAAPDADALPVPGFGGMEDAAIETSAAIQGPIAIKGLPSAMDLL